MFEPISERTLKIINPPNLMRLVRVKVLKPFCLNGKPLPVGEEAAIEFHLARDLQAIGKAEFV